MFTNATTWVIYDCRQSEGGHAHVNSNISAIKSLAVGLYNCSRSKQGYT